MTEKLHHCQRKSYALSGTNRDLCSQRLLESSEVWARHEHLPELRIGQIDIARYYVNINHFQLALQKPWHTDWRRVLLGLNHHLVPPMIDPATSTYAKGSGILRSSIVLTSAGVGNLGS